MQTALPIARDIFATFNTPILIRRIEGWAETNAALSAQILAAEQHGGGVDISNRGGWHSTTDLWTWPGEAIAQYRRWVHQAITHMTAFCIDAADADMVAIEYQAQAWANVNRHGSYNAKHCHGFFEWSVVYYVQTGQVEPGRPQNGCIELFDPRTMAANDKRRRFGFGSTLVIDPVPGRLVVFPAWIDHWVQPFFGAGARISIAANIHVTGGTHTGRA
jgi:uncharacterized protein (TIGR02466 family)